ncbi:MAG: M23 family metallopeptidase [Anaerolineales bacterium]|nr:M23 family metallopeptidase [Anaerolineales bacterium]
MQNFFEKIRVFFAGLTARFGKKPKPQAAVSAVHEPATKPRNGNQPKRKIDRFMAVSWGVTALIVASLLGSTLIYKNARGSQAALPPQPTAEPGSGQTPISGGPTVSGEDGAGEFITRALQLKTNIPERPRSTPVIYRVSRGDAMLSIAEKFKIDTETILFANDELDDNPHNIKPGTELTIPPVDGIYYKWKEGDTFDSVAQKFETKPDEIIDFIGNNIDLTDPQVLTGALVMVPGGTRELRNWAQDLQTAGRGANTGTGGANATNVCGGGPVASGFGWPANSHNISGNGYSPSHLGLDIQANEGDPVYAAGAGIVTMAQGGWNYGYGNVVQIDHGNGYVTVYAHLSSYNVSVCTPVGQGTVIGAAGNTGNSFGAHLHFEVRIGGANVNPYQIVQ